MGRWQLETSLKISFNFIPFGLCKQNRDGKEDRVRIKVRRIKLIYNHDIRANITQISAVLLRNDSNGTFLACNLSSVIPPFDLTWKIAFTSKANLYLATWTLNLLNRKPSYDGNHLSWLTAAIISQQWHQRVYETAELSNTRVCLLSFPPSHVTHTLHYLQHLLYGN